MPGARDRDYGAWIRAILDALGKAEGRNKPLPQEEFANRVGTAPSAVKKWLAGKGMELDSIVKVNKVAPPELRYRIENGGQPPTDVPVVVSRPAQPQLEQSTSIVVPKTAENIFREFVRTQDGRKLTDLEWELLRAALAAASKP